MRRGRWAAYKVMSIYLQEVSAITYLNKIPLSSKSKILKLAENFVPLHQKAISFSRAAIPCDLWWQQPSKKKNSAKVGRLACVM